MGKNPKWLGIFSGVLFALGCGPPPQPVLSVQEIYEAEGGALAPLPTMPELKVYTEAKGFPEYLIGPDDILEIALRDVIVTKETVTVRPDGNISFSLAENVQAAGRTTTELDSALTAALARFLREPKVDIQVSQYKSRMVSVVGAILSVSTAAGQKTGQGRYPLKGRTTVLDAILEAGGYTSDAQLDQVQLIRGGRSYRLDLQRVMDTGDLTHNVILQGEDIIIVSGSGRLSKKVIVLGEVVSPNVYMFGEDASLLEAVSRAGGFTPQALDEDIRVIRGTGRGPQMFTVDFAQIANNFDLQQNVSLQNSDIIYVPRSFMGDVNEVIAKVEPLLNLLLLPASYRDLYSTGGGLRLDTGLPPSTDTGTGFVRTLPGTGAAKPAVPQAEEEGEEKEDREEREE